MFIETRPYRKSQDNVSARAPIHSLSSHSIQAKSNQNGRRIENPVHLPFLPPVLGTCPGAGRRAHTPIHAALVHQIVDTQYASTTVLQPVLDQLGGAWLYLAFSEAFILRETDDIRMWKLHFIGLLLSDSMMFWSYYLAMGHEVFFNPMLWRLEDWGNIILTCGPLFRIAFLFDIGLGRAKAAERAKKVQ